MSFLSMLTSHTESLKRSFLGQTQVYNRLQQHVVDACTVNTFQQKLQEALKEKAGQNTTGRNL